MNSRGMGTLKCFLSLATYIILSVVRPAGASGERMQPKISILQTIIANSFL